jgi:hypothetical protein
MPNEQLVSVLEDGKRFSTIKIIKESDCFVDYLSLLSCFYITRNNSFTTTCMYIPHKKNVIEDGKRISQLNYPRVSTFFPARKKTSMLLFFLAFI